MAKGSDFRSDIRMIGLMWLITAALLGVAVWRYTSAGALGRLVSVEAQVVGAARVGQSCSRQSGARNCQPLYRYRVHFNTREGRPVEGWTNKGTVSRYRRGERMSVRYKRENPRFITTDAPVYHWIVVAIFGLLGLLALVGSIRATVLYLKGRGA